LLLLALQFAREPATGDRGLFQLLARFRTLPHIAYHAFAAVVIAA